MVDHGAATPQRPAVAAWWRGFLENRIMTWAMGSRPIPSGKLTKNYGKIHHF